MNKFSRVFLLFLILVMMISTIGCKETFYSEWKDDDIVVDGFNKDWNNHGKMFLEDVGMSFGMTNDADSLYLLMQFRDVKTHKMFARSGATIWFCHDGKKDKKLGYKYYGKELIEFKDQQQMKPPQGMDQNANMPQNFGGRPGGKEIMGGGGMPDNAEHYNKILVVDSEEEIFESLSENGPIGPHAGCGYSEGVFVYEFVFPLKQEYSYSLDIDPGQEVLVCIDFPPAMPSLSSSRSGGPGGGGRGGGGMGGPPGGGGMGGGPGGGGPGGGKPGGGGPGEINLKPRTMWFSLQLAPEAE